jgi:hypothetical protein
MHVPTIGNAAYVYNIYKYLCILYRYLCGRGVGTRWYKSIIRIVRK